MDSWESLVLQWINCLWETNGDRIATLDQLEDGVVYHKLISQVKPWSSTEYHGSEKEMVLQFLHDEYPKFSLKNKNERLRKLSIASLVLSRLSLEPIFHKSLCANLSADMQIKVKLVLESVYPLGKQVTEEDFFKIFSLQKKPDFESPALKPRFLLEEFLKSPIMRTVHSDSKIHEQSRQLRRLRAEIETMSYEKSELVEDIKAQEKQIKELQKKLHGTLIELKALRQVDHKAKEADFFSKTGNGTSTELTYKREVQSLESYVSELQNENVQLQDEKSHLADKVKIYKEKYSAMKNENHSNREAIESMLLQLEKKEEELAELKLRHEELCNHLKEKSKVFLNNVSCEYDDRSMNESSFNKSLNKSETLSSVVDIQLQETRRDLIAMQNNFKYINSILTVLIEEYNKLKKQAKVLANQNSEDEESLDSFHVSKDVKSSLANVFREDSKRIIFFDLLNGSVTPVVKLNNLTSMKSKKKYAMDLLDYKEKLKVTFKYGENHVDKFTCTFYDAFWQKYWNGNLFVLLKVILQEITKLKLESGKENDLDTSLISVTQYKGFSCNEIYSELLNLVKNNCSVKFNVPKPKKLSSVSVQTDKKNYSSTTVQTDVKNYCSSYVQTDNKDYSSKEAQTDVKIYFTTSAQTDTKNYFSTSIQTDVKEYLSIPIQTDEKSNSSISIQTDNDDEVSSFTQDELKSLQSTWVQLSDSIQSDSKIFKTLSLLNDSWSLALKSFKEVSKNYESLTQPELKELLTEKDSIESNMKEIYSRNLKLLSMHLASTVQMVATLTKDLSFGTTSLSKEYDSDITKNLTNGFSDVFTNIDSPDSSKLSLLQREINDEIFNVREKINDFDSSVKSYEAKLSLTPTNIKVEKDSFKDEEHEIPTKLSSEDISRSPEFQHYVKELHEKYETKLEKMKEKMKSAFNNQITILKKEQEIALKNKVDSLQSKFEYQCLSHTEELKKYKKHIGELTTQLWDVGEKLIIEKQKKEDFHKRFKDLKTKCENIENQPFGGTTAVPTKPKPDMNVSQLSDITFSSKNNIQHVRGFQIMGNAFSNEDEEGEVFDTTYLTDMQRPRESLSTVDVNRLSILQLRNSKCKPHLKSSYPTEVQHLPATLTEDDIKSGNPEEFLNDSLSQSLLTGEKVKRKVRSRNNSETPRRSRRFSNIFRKPRISVDHK
ncbi:golgin subfamily A member 4-like [Copidosoma floridanum]|uniref:golgin subfamily A member 4-like n=1 Tax=Copidosoma floridanum TaxID=29053 RepID=UPI0006C9D287|nr:golgin subfamily A member 4-like [Copidosoma floridanum]